MMTLTIQDIIKDIKRHLSIIGKRMYNNGGKNMFSDITLSSAEDTNILTQYINISAQDIEAMLKQFITHSQYSDTKIDIVIENTRGDADFEYRTKYLCLSFITLNTLGEYLSMVHPELAQKYQADARQRMESLIGYVFYKQPPETSSVDPIAAVSTRIDVPVPNVPGNDPDDPTNEDNN